MSVRSIVPLLVLALVSVTTASAAVSRDRTPPTTPKNLRVTASGPTSVSLAWDASTDNSSNWYYCVKLSGQGCFRVDQPRTTFTHPLLWPDRTYEFSVVAQDMAGNKSAPSNTVRVTTPPDLTAPSPPPVLSTTGVSPTRISLTWTQSKDNVSQVYYTLFKDGTPQTSNMIGLNGLTVLDLTPSTTYEFRVEARDAFGNTAHSNVLSVTTTEVTDTVPPTVPTNLRLSSESTPPEIWLDWDQSTDDVDPQQAILYDVYINGELDHAAVGTGETVTYCRPEGVLNRIVVRAVDSSGNVSGPSNEVLFDC
jgi:chitodextrinase